MGCRSQKLQAQGVTAVVDTGLGAGQRRLRGEDSSADSAGMQPCRPEHDVAPEQAAYIVKTSEGVASRGYRSA